jgi:hypothetical protein
MALQRDDRVLYHQQMHDSAAAAAADGLSHLPDCEENVASFCGVLKLQINVVTILMIAAVAVAVS